MIILVWASDAVRLREHVAQIRQQFKEKQDPSGMNEDVLVVRDVAAFDPSEVVRAASAAPFLAQKRMVVVRGALAAVTKKAAAQAFAVQIAATPESSVVVLADVIPQGDAIAHPFVIALKAQVTCREYALPDLDAPGVAAWAAARSQRMGIAFAPGAWHALTLRVGADVERMDAELQKLSAYGSGSPLTPEIVGLLVAPQETASDVFGVGDALLGAASGPALQKLQEERAAGASEQQLFFLIVRQIRVLLQIHDVLAATPRAGKAEVAAATGLHPFVAQKTLPLAKKFSFPALIALHRLARTADVAMKSGASDRLMTDRLAAALLLARA